jgi:N-glycosylase/DNA lyase
VTRTEKRQPVLPVTIENIRAVHAGRAEEISSALEAFATIGRAGDDRVLWEEMVFCFFTGGCSARMGINALEAVKPVLMTAGREELTQRLLGVHRYPNARAGYVVHSREFLIEHCGMKLRDKLFGFECRTERRDWLVREKGIKGLGYKEASHYLRNIGFRGYAILDKHVLNCLAELGVIGDPKPPSTRSRYLETEQAYIELAGKVEIDPDELDLVLWSMKTGIILK